MKSLIATHLLGAGLLISSSRCQYTPAADLRVVFQYNGLLEADPADGGYKKVLPGRLVDPGKLVTWTPAVYSTPARGNSESLLKLLPKRGNEKKHVVTWTPTLRRKLQKTAKVDIVSDETTTEGLSNKKPELLTWTDPIPLGDVQPTSVYIRNTTADPTSPSRTAISADIQEHIKNVTKNQNHNHAFSTTTVTPFSLITSAKTSSESSSKATPISVTILPQRISTSTTTTTTITTTTTKTTVSYSSFSPPPISLTDSISTWIPPRESNAEKLIYVLPSEEDTRYQNSFNLSDNTLYETSEKLENDADTKLTSSNDEFFHWLHGEDEFNALLSNIKNLNTNADDDISNPPQPSPINILDWLASKSKLKQHEAGGGGGGVDDVDAPVVVHSVDGDVLQHWQEAHRDYVAPAPVETDEEDMDMAESSLQVSIPDSLDEERIVQGEGGVIYVDYDVVTADYSVLSTEDGAASDEKMATVIQHNNKLVNILKNTVEMQAFLFDKLLNYLF